MGDRVPFVATRKDAYLNYLAFGGDFASLPEPISDDEIYLYRICENRGSGGNTVPPEFQTATKNEIVALFR